MSTPHQPNDPTNYGPSSPYQQPYQTTARPQKPKRKVKWWHVLIGVLVLLFIIGQCSGPGVQENTETAQEQLDPEPAPEPEPTQDPEPEPEPSTESVPPQVVGPPPQDDSDARFLELMRSEAPMMSADETDEDLRNIARGVCIQFDTGKTYTQLVMEFIDPNDPAANAELGAAIGLAVAAKCPEHLPAMTEEIERLQSR